MNTDDIITDVLKREDDEETNDPLDAGGRTKYGISEKANPEAWADGKVDEEEARRIYERKYVIGPGFDKVTDFQLRAQLVDFGVNSGPMIAIHKLQEVLQTADPTVDVDYILGPQTLGAITQWHPEAINNALVKARVKMICRIVTKNPTQLKWLNGWVNRALEFI